VAGGRGVGPEDEGKGKSPWLLIAALVPVVGWAWYVIECGFLPPAGSKVPEMLVKRTVTAEAASEDSE
jgi:hypothetical protein